MTETKEYKSKLFREGNTLVFRSGDFEQRWDSFQYISSANEVCLLFIGNYSVKDYESYVKEATGKNNSILGSFMNKENLQNHEYNLSIDYRKKLKYFRYKGFIQKYGISSSNFKKIFNAIMREIWEVKPYFSRYCLDVGYKGRIKINEYKVRLLHEHKDLILEAQNNNLNNMIPFIFYSGLSFKDLKDCMGENLWDSLMQNSHSRNNLIALKAKQQFDLNKKINIKKRTPPDFYKIKEPFKIDMRNVFDWIEYYNLFPSTILSDLPYIENSPATLALKECCTPKEFKKEYAHSGDSLLRIITSVIAICSTYGYDYSLKLTKEEWLKKYERLNNRDLKNTPF
jgi:hypothetical protein